MILKFYDNIDVLYEKIMSGFDDVEIQDNLIIINKDKKKLSIRIEQEVNTMRSFSIVFGNNECFNLILHSSNIKNFENEVKIIKNICLEYTDEEINTIISDMKVCNWYANKHKNELKNVAIIWRDHFLEENIGLLSGLVTMGVSPENIMVFDKGDSTKHRFEITETFKKMKFIIDILDNTDLGDETAVKVGKEKIFKFIEDRKDMKIIVMDDGAIITKVLEDKKFDNIISVIELTEMGLRRIKELNTIPYPVLNMAKTKLKKYITYPEISNTIFVRIIELLRGEKIVGKKAIVCGYGDLGTILADRLRSYGVQVNVVDTDILRLIVAGEKGFNTYENIFDACKDGAPFIIIGASGYYSITKSIFTYLNEKTYITAGATADLNAFKDCKEISNFIDGLGTQYIIDNKKIIVLGNGRSVNLYQSEAIPNKSNDIFKAGQLVTVYNSINTDYKLNNTIESNIVDEWIDESGILNQYYNIHFKKLV